MLGSVVQLRIIMCKGLPRGFSTVGKESFCSLHPHLCELARPWKGLLPIGLARVLASSRKAFVRIFIYKNEAIKYFSIKVHTCIGPNMSVSINSCRGLLTPAQTLYESVGKFTFVLNCAFSIFNSMYIHTIGSSG